MKTFNLVFSVMYAAISFVAGMFALFLKRIDLGAISGACAFIAWLMYNEFKNKN
jgi:hypothetical protein